MAFKFATGSKFDDATKSVSQAAKKINDATWEESLRRAIESISNRVLGGAESGTAAADKASNMAAGCGTGGAFGIGTTAGLAVIINGRAGTRASAGSYNLPSGTQAASTYVKYGIFGGFGTAGTVLAGNESLTSTGAYLPDCPSGLVVLGYMQYLAGTSAGGWNRGANVVTGQTGSSGTATFVDLVHMPLYET